MKQNLIETKNKLKLNKLIKNHFNLMDESQKLFEQRLKFERPIAKEWKEIIGDAPDLRARFDVGSEYLKSVDEGWEIFQNEFPSYIDSRKISYENFRENSVVVNKNKVKIGKDLINFYKDYAKKTYLENISAFFLKNIEEQIRLSLEEIGKKKLPKDNNFKLVVSLNFADWFMCSTSENWTSCLDVESRYEESFWIGLPGLIGDKNRALIYLTDGKKKRYEGIEVDRFLNRSWALLQRGEKKESKGKVFIVKSYPNSFPIDRMLEGALERNNIDIQLSSEDFHKGRYYVELLYHKTLNPDIGYVSMPYLDRGMLKISRKNKAKHFPGRYGHYRSGGGVAPRYWFDFLREKTGAVDDSSEDIAYIENRHGGLSYYIQRNKQFESA